MNRSRLLVLLPGALLVWISLSFCYKSQAQENRSLSPGPPVQAVLQLLAIGPGEKLKNQECGGTGFLINAEGYIVTSAHVVEEARRCLERSPGAKIMARLQAPGETEAAAISCDVVAVDDLHDLAVVRPERPVRAEPRAPSPSFLTLDPTPLADGAPVATTGHPLFVWRPTTQSGKVVRLEKLRLGGAGTEPTEILLLDMSVQPGNSGSPVFRVGAASAVGVIEGQKRGLVPYAIAIPVRFVIELLNRYGVDWHAAL